MDGWKRWAAIAGCVYLVFWIGGNYSFGYTHNCVRSHKEFVGEDDREVTICDWYTANGKRWTFGDPLRALRARWLSGGWIDAAVLGGIGLLIAYGVWRGRRQEPEHDPAFDWDYDP